ncbi:hypothetical protein [Flavobacterium ustbae]|uniref:hypothetical protein n=1 Tax=Flavobacterium ustbae TaxID=2488790 RepID=UPI000F788363|nr:hypothetical protein [Flavobacterium ustbae]
MENIQINFSPKNKTCTDRTLVCIGDNNELIFRKTYVGDWGDWDEKPEDRSKDHLYLDQNTSFTSAV